MTAPFQILAALFCSITVSALAADAPTPDRAPAPAKVKRYGKVIGVKEEKLEEYKRLHANVWPEVNAMLRACNMRNFTIFLRKLPDGKHYLFMYFEYTGNDLDADSKKMAADPTTQRWWKLTDPCQEPLPDRKPGDWWADMEELCHND
jgi:L-rhamnose mutarotase